MLSLGSAKSDPEGSGFRGSEASDVRDSARHIVHQTRIGNSNAILLLKCIYIFNLGLMIGELKIGPVDKMRDVPH